jgi:hypothetical protein
MRFNRFSSLGYSGGAVPELAMQSSKTRDPSCRTGVPCCVGRVANQADHQRTLKPAANIPALGRSVKHVKM